MSLKPGKHNGYWPSSTTYSEDGTIRGYGSDGSEGSKVNNTDYVLYIGFEPNDRVLAFKAFLDSIKLIISKDGSWDVKKDNLIPVFTPLSGKAGYQITLNLPAHSSNESRNNLAKIAELQRMITPSNLLPIRQRSGGRGPATRLNIFRVLFRNLINSGSGNIDATSAPDNFNELIDMGLPCYIENVKYEPDLEMGFFSPVIGRSGTIDTGKYPKNIKLNLTLNIVTDYAGTVLSSPIRSFNSNGTYSSSDAGFFPFLVKPYHDNGEVETGRRNFNNSPAFLKQSNMNKLSFQQSERAYIFISIPIKKTMGMFYEPTKEYAIHKRTRYVMFKPFIEEFTRDYKTTVTLQDFQDAAVYTKPKDFSHDIMTYAIKFNVVSHSVTEAIQNCAKIQYLIKMFYKLNKCKNDGLTEQERNYLRVYIPQMIENAGSTGASVHGQPDADFETNYNNSAAVVPQTLDFNIDATMGFFENNGNLYPKVMSIGMELTDGQAANMQQLYLRTVGGNEVYDFAETANASDRLDNIFAGNNPGNYPLNKKYTKSSNFPGGGGEPFARDDLERALLDAEKVLEATRLLLGDPE